MRQIIWLKFNKHATGRTDNGAVLIWRQRGDKFSLKSGSDVWRWGMSDLRQMRGWHLGLVRGLDNLGPPPEARGHILPHSDGAASAASSCMEPRSEVCQFHLSGQLLFYFVKGKCGNILRRNHWSKQNLHTHLVLAKKNTNTDKHIFLLSYKIKYGFTQFYTYIQGVQEKILLCFVFVT